MPTPGYVFRDGHPIPDSDLRNPKNQVIGAEPTLDRIARTSASTTSETSPPQLTPSSSASIGTGDSTTVSGVSDPSGNAAPTDSHALAEGDAEIKGAAQMNDSAGEVRDMGWQQDPKHVPMLVGGLENDELWTLVRRFNKQLYHVKATHEPLLAGLDLNIVDEDEFSPDKLRSNVERLYMTVIIGLMGAGKHMARLRSWREPRRTAAFCAAYMLAWVFNLIVPLIITTLITLIVYPPARHILFPHAPLALVSSKTGGVQTPQAGVLGSHDSATGASEHYKGEAVEAEAHNFVSGIGTIALSSAAGKHDSHADDAGPVDASVPDPTAIASAGADANVAAKGGKPAATHDKTKQPMEEAMWKKMRPIMHVIGDIADGWERFANALSPTRPFPQQKPRIVLASVLAPLLAVSLLTSSAVFMKGVTGGIGFGLFGDPLIRRGLILLNKELPNWQKLLELRNSILKGVPTNAQLTITLLRIGERNKAPLPPPPSSDQPPPSKPASLDGDALALDTNEAELHEAIHKDDAQREKEQQAAAAETHKHKHGEHVLGFFKGTTHAGVDTKFGIDKARAKILGSSKAKDHLGVIPKNFDPETSGPVDFKCRYKGRKGWVYISTHTTIPTISFSYASTDATGQTPEREGALWSIPLEDVTELKKVGGLGWKSKIVVSWATGKTVADGLEIVDRSGLRHKVTAVRLREELFNRLISIGSQKWESW